MFQPQVSQSPKVFSSSSREIPSGVTLRPFTLAHIDDFMEWATDSEVTRHMMWDAYTNRSQVEEFFVNFVEKHPWFKAICLDDRIIGSIALDKGQGKYSCKAELGYVVARKNWGKGHATQAIKLAAELGFEDLGVTRIEAFVDPNNLSSQRVLEKNGFFREGLLHNWLIQKGVIKDRVIYSKTIDK